MDFSLLLVSLLIGLLIGGITVGAMRAQLRSVHRQTDAGSYMNPGSLHLTQNRDVFLYQTTTRHPRPKQNTKR